MAIRVYLKMPPAWLARHSGTCANVAEMCFYSVAAGKSRAFFEYMENNY
jgi:hypothetical protein